MQSLPDVMVEERYCSDEHVAVESFKIFQVDFYVHSFRVLMVKTY